MHCLDTNAVIGVLKGRPARLLRRFEAGLAQGTLAVSCIVAYELRYGVAKSERRATNDDRLNTFFDGPIPLLSFDAEDAREAGELRAALERSGTPIGAYDLLIAAQTRRRGAVLVTANTREFTRVPGLTVEDWAASA